ncbi:C-type mannose receptor 2-like 2 [Homarus americanus]|uniref:C-type mannose receptor 2-like 2 n=1 Tax=Homarus americanus TaxID=6706 RepID=A0A8J5N699_HOMAM|nr:C-type mannose receptor 2-like 2 [Homarus americanus]
MTGEKNEDEEEEGAWVERRKIGRVQGEYIFIPVEVWLDSEMTTTKPWLLLMTLPLLFYVGRGTTTSCSPREIECATGEQCISTRLVCKGGTDCPDSSDENPEICEKLLLGKLEDVVEAPKDPKPQLKLADCPSLYTKLGDQCVSFLPTAKVPWPEARQFCKSIYSDLWTFSDPTSFLAMYQFIRNNNVTFDLWIGGYYDQQQSAWAFIQPGDSNHDAPIRDDLPNNAMPLGFPYWAPRCAIVNHNLSFYLSDEECQNKHTPLCLLVSDPRLQ